MKKLLYISLSLILLACKQQKSVVEYKHITDTLIVSKTQTIYQAVNDTTYIENPCDSIGILNRFYTKIAIPFGQVVLKSDNGKIKAIVKTDKLQITNDKSVSKKTNYQTINKEIVKYRIPSWLIMIVFFETLIIIAYLFFKLWSMKELI